MATPKGDFTGHEAKVPAEHPMKAGGKAPAIHSHSKRPTRKMSGGKGRGKKAM